MNHLWTKKLTNFTYIIGCLGLYLVAAVVIGYGIYGFFAEFFKKTFLVYNLLDEIGLIMFGIAVVDIAKYLLSEGVLKEGEFQDVNEVRRTLTKIICIISTALFIKGLIMTMEVSKVDVTLVFYPLFVVISPVFLLIGLGIYYYLSKPNGKS